ncbi:uncharacterized protein LOC6736585 [Drosophila simulans]|uniref:GD13737 n=1 Tax=Drosophila simulans TaxID=7240 RepID=B4QP37_DROSI|nr:uncharacterized protein LOC6736585 [Drosophila simulans]EDX09032.1 GD13737 [Drosophila simulans]KMY97288.1 uncharacterized protein Dsimw501_GD13737 [Drosophila simulans]
MWTSLIVSLLLVQCLLAGAAPALKDLDAGTWSAEEACQNVDKSVIIANQNDSTCATFVYCYKVDDSTRALIKSCKSGQFFDADLEFCSVSKPAGCV